jgi:catechol 2,3-dioxygenase-like lactoylglutathione lyase family enzyme
MSTLTYEFSGVHVKVADIKRSRDFYEGLLDFKPSFAYGPPEFLATIPEGVGTAPEKYPGVLYEAVNGAPFEIAADHIAIEDKSVFKTPMETAKISSFMRVASLVPLLVEKKFRPKFPVRHYYWNTIEAVFRDPDGFVIVLTVAYSEEEAESLKEAGIEIEHISPSA